MRNTVWKIDFMKDRIEYIHYKQIILQTYSILHVKYTIHLYQDFDNTL